MPSSRARWGLVILLLSSGACGTPGSGDTPSAPSPIPPDALSVVGPRPATSGTALTGKIVDSLTGEPVAGARIEAGGAALQSDGNGHFALPAELSGVQPLRIEAAGHFARETRVEMRIGSALEIDLIPEGQKFDLDFFDHVFRHLGEEGTHPYAAEPTFEILERVLDCVDLNPQEYCDEFEALDDAAPEQFLALAEQTITDDARRYTGGRVAGFHVTREPIAPGTRIVRRDGWVRDTVRFALVQLPTSSSWASMWYYRGSGSMYSGLVMINKRHKSDRGVYSHELAHTLGYSHPRGGNEIPLPSIMRYGHDETPDPNDVLHGAILYRRPAGSRTPDRDPEDFVLNAVRTVGAAGGELVDVVVR